MRKPDINDRIRKANTLNEERKTQEYERIQESLAVRREAEELLKWKGIIRFEIALTAFQIVRMLEEQRDRNMPKPPDFEWNEKFSEAIRFLPDAITFAKDCWYSCVEDKKE